MILNGKKDLNFCLERLDDPRRVLRLAEETGTPAFVVQLIKKAIKDEKERDAGDQPVAAPEEIQ